MRMKLFERSRIKTVMPLITAVGTFREVIVPNQR
jgi:hypothetical protein